MPRVINIQRTRNWRAAASRGAGRRSSRIILVCGVGTGNIGNDCSLVVARHLFRQLRPDVEVCVATPHTEGARKLLTEPVIPLGQNLRAHKELGSITAIMLAVVRGELTRLRSLSSWIRGSDLVVVTGTGIFDDFGEKPWGMPYSLLTWVAMTRSSRRPFAFMCVGAGPIVGRSNRTLMLAAARMASTISYRDQASWDYMRRHRVDVGDHRVCPDLAFGYPISEVSPVNDGKGPLRVGVGVMDYGGWSKGHEGPEYERYVNCLVGVVKELRREGHEIRLLIGQPVDVPVVRDVVDRCRANGVVGLAEPDIYDFDSLLAAVSTTDVVIGTRYHNVVAAVMMHRPVISLSYAPKNGELLRAVGLLEFDRPVEKADTAWVMERFRDLQEGRRTMVDGLDSLMEDWVEDLNREAARVLALTDGKADAFMRRFGRRRRTGRPIDQLRMGRLVLTASQGATSYILGRRLSHISLVKP